MIVSHDDFVSGLAPFVSWKRQRGFDVTVARLSESGATSTGIKNLIQSRYDADPSLAFVILAGDAGQVPFFPGTVGNAIGKEADPMYGLVAGADSYPDLIVARFAVQTSAELENIVSRSIRYEREPDLNGAWYARGMGIASNEGTPTDGERAELLRTMLESWRFTSVDRFYDPGVTAVGIANALNEGRSFINYIGHGSETGWVTGAFNNAQIDGLTNTDKLPIVISVACVNGNFNYANGDSFAERWLKAGTAAEPRGALAVFASSTNQSWVPPTVGQKEIVRLLTEERARTVGGLMMNGSVAVLEDASTTAVQTFQTWHIFGDPTIAIRTKAPIAIGAVVPQVWDASGTLAIETSEAGLTVTAIDGNRVLARGISGVHGEVTLRLDPSLVSTQRVLVTVTGRDRVPVEVVVNVD